MNLSFVFHICDERRWQIFDYMHSFVFRQTRNAKNTIAKFKTQVTDEKLHAVHKCIYTIIQSLLFTIFSSKAPN